MERDENTCREPFTLLEAKKMMEMIGGFEKAAAKERQLSGLRNVAKKPRSVKLTERENGQSRDKVAAAARTGAAVGIEVARIAGHLEPDRKPETRLSRPPAPYPNLVAVKSSAYAPTTPIHTRRPVHANPGLIGFACGTARA
ncbi:hypothetical protein [uncultured Thiodictyon sp.]|uniref:hypothetical protein n=1 Tax=uncultured Thiodictyon sp. TaxID=1846217 RepID=UPI0025E51A2D|nr:hypothetical protein [uncultured Thiodictyon sp.]